MDAEVEQPRSLWPLGVIPLPFAIGFSFLNDWSGGLSLLLGPLCAGLATGLLISRKGGKWPTAVALLAAAITLVEMLLVIFVVIFFWGI